jgi:hypothetical protein
MYGGESWIDFQVWRENMVMLPIELERAPEAQRLFRQVGTEHEAEAVFPHNLTELEGIRLQEIASD